MSQLLRRAFCWKSAFYGVFLPLLSRLGAARCDAVIRALGKALVWLRPGAKARLRQALGRAKEALDLDGPVEDLWPELAAGTLRTLAHDYPLDCRSDHEALGRFDVVGAAQLERDLAAGRGVILVGSHLGAYIEGLHWLYRRGLPVRALVQRPWHVSGLLTRRFDDDTGPHPQSSHVPETRPDASASSRVAPACSRGPARRSGGLSLRRHPLDQPEHTTGTVAGRGASVPFHLDRACCLDPGPRLPRLLHPPKGRSVPARSPGRRPNR